MMDREQFEKVALAIAQAAEMMPPAFNYAQASELNDKAIAEIKAERDKIGTGVKPKYSEMSLKRVEAFGELLLAAALFKEAAETVTALGPDPRSPIIGPKN